MRDRKVFCIGFHKTGTTSLADALRELGYSVHGYFQSPSREAALETALSLVPEHDAFEDMPWPLLYRELDAAHPGSRFILTLRPYDRWFESVVGHFAGRPSPNREWIYGSADPRGHLERYVEVHRAHVEGVLDHFRDREDDLLRLRVTEGEGWPELCAFLGEPVPDRPFPHRTSQAEVRRRRLRRGAASLVRRIAARLR